MNTTIRLGAAFLLLALLGCGGAPGSSPAAVQTLDDAASLCKLRGVELTGLQTPSQGDIKARVYKVGAVNVAMTQFASADETKTWVVNVSKMPGGQSNALACGAVAILLTGGGDAERQKIVKALE